jgi:F0F1-type ATP synthase membrane subunit a
MDKFLRNKNRCGDRLDRLKPRRFLAVAVSVFVFVLVANSNSKYDPDEKNLPVLLPTIIR